MDPLFLFSCSTPELGTSTHEKLTLAIKSTIPLEIPNVRSTLSHSQERDDVSMQEYHQGSNLSMRTGSFWVMKQPVSGSWGTKLIKRCQQMDGQKDNFRRIFWWDRREMSDSLKISCVVKFSNKNLLVKFVGSLLKTA